jgi:hypothetical protein
VQALAAIAAVVASIVGHPTPVTCETTAQWGSDPAVAADIALYGVEPAAYTRLGADVQREIVLGPFGCRYLTELFASPRTADSETRFYEGEALLMLLHESEHAAGWAAENDAECRAISAYLPVARTVGAPPAGVADLSAAAITYHESMPIQYRTGCEQPALSPAAVPSPQVRPERGSRRTPAASAAPQVGPTPDTHRRRR